MGLFHWVQSHIIHDQQEYFQGDKFPAEAASDETRAALVGSGALSAAVDEDAAPADEDPPETPGTSENPPSEESSAEGNPEAEAPAEAEAAEAPGEDSAADPEA